MEASFGASTFIIKTYHESLKYLLKQRITNEIQKKGLSKLMGLSYQVIYRKDRENRVADALLRQWEETKLNSILTITPKWMTEAKKSYNGDQDISRLYQQLQKPNPPPNYRFTDRLVHYKRRLLIGRETDLRQKLLELYITTLTADTQEY